MTQNNSILKRAAILTKAAMIFLWAVLAAVLTVTATLICTVKILKPEVLTPIAGKIATDIVDANVNIGRAELAFRPAFPLLEIRMDSVCIISHAFDTIPEPQRNMLPGYSDTLLRFERLKAGIDISALLKKGEISISDIELRRPELNIVFSHGGIANFDIFRSEPDTTTSSATVIPPVSLRRFAITDPQPIRYFNSADSTEATILLLEHVSIDGSGAPEYEIAVHGKINTPYAGRFLQRNAIRFGSDGCVMWDPSAPGKLGISRFRLNGAFMEATVDAVMNLSDTLRIDSASLTVNPVPIDSILTVFPDSLRRTYGITPDLLKTDAAIALKARLTAPFSPVTDSVPFFETYVSIAPSEIKFGRATFHNLSLDLKATVDGPDPDATIVDIRKFTIAGPATAIEVSGKFGKLISDPRFDCKVRGDIRFENFPPEIVSLLKGRISGRLKVNIEAHGNSSMFELGHFHRLDIRGNAVATGIDFQSDDTAQNIALHKAMFRFGSRYATNDTGARAPALAAALRIDSANAVISGVNLRIKDFAVGLGIENGGRPVDTLSVIPMGGGIGIGSIRVLSVADSTGMYMRGLRGRVGLRRHLGNSHAPEITIEAGMERFAAGAPLARIMLRNANLKATTYLRPERLRRRREIKHIYDSIASVKPGLTPDSIYALTLEQRRLRNGRRPHRHHSNTQEENIELIDWGIPRGFSRYLNDWHLEGHIGTDRASLFTPYFPLRNRISNVKMRFCNDSITVDSLRYNAGSSDLTLCGSITDLRRSLAGRRKRPLRISFDIISDTLDINQFAATTFAGAAFAERVRKGESVRPISIDDPDDDAGYGFDSTDAASDTLAPVLIPYNIDATIGVRASNILYSDLHMRDFRGKLLIYNGAVNLNRLSAVSDAGNINLSALYSAPRVSDIKCGLGLELNGFNIERFLKLVPAIDSIMPLMRDFAGTIDAGIAATVDIDSVMNLKLPTLDAAIHLSGRDLAFIDPETYRTIGKWLRFRNRADNHIRHMSVELLVRDNQMQIFPFQFDIDRYTLGVVGSNDLAMNFDYHISVLKSPLPFKFGITVKGNPDKYKVRLGGARFKPGMAAERVEIVDTVRVNLIRQIQNVFRRGVSNSRFARLETHRLDSIRHIGLGTDTLSRNDSIILVSQNPDQDIMTDSIHTTLSE